MIAIYIFLLENYYLKGEYVEYCDNLVESRKGFIEQLSNLVNSQFDGQNTLSENLKETEKILSLKHISEPTRPY